MKLIVSIGSRWCVLSPSHPGKFMMRMRMPNGIVTSNQMRVLGEVVQRYGDDGNADITTRQNIQLRASGLRMCQISSSGFRQLLTSVQSGMDNVRNITGDPVAGIDAEELFDTRELVRQVQDMITNKGRKPRLYQPTPEIQHCDHWWT